MNEVKLNRLVKKWKPRLGLSDWQIILKITETKTDGAYMEVDVFSSYERAVIRVAPWVIDSSIERPEDVSDYPLNDEYIEQYLVHELLHLPLSSMKGVLLEDLEGMLHRDVHEIAVAAFKRHEEAFVDKLAVALTKEWPR